MVARNRDLSPDAQGRFRPYLGWRKTGDGQYVQHRFNLGRDREKAERIIIRLRQLWQQIESESANSPASNSPRPLWTSHTLWIADQIAKGNPTITLPKKSLDDGETYACYFNRVQAHYPFIVFVPENQDEYQAAAATNSERIEQKIKGIEQAAIRSGNLPRKRVIRDEGMLYEAFDAYAEHIRQTQIETDEQGEQTVTAHGKALVDGVERYKEHHPDVPLAGIDFDELQQMVNHWRSRPLRKGTKRPITGRSAQNEIKRLVAFFKWLHRTPKFAWRKPEDFDELGTKVKLSASEIEDRATAEQVETYSIGELQTLYEYATPLERCLMLLGLNCGFAPSEQGTLRVKHLALRHEHPSADKLGWKTSPEDSFVKKLRNKTKVYGEWLLWDHTVKAMDWLVARHRKSGNTTNNSLLMVTGSGTPFYRLTGGGNRSQKFANIWSTLTRRIRDDKDHKDFPFRSFGKLRKTGGNMVRRLMGGEIHSVYVCHGSPVKADDLAELYSNRPYAKLFETLRKIEDELQPLWDAVSDPFGRYTQQYTSLSKVRRIKAMDQDGVPVAEIAEAVGVSRMTVYRHTKKQGVQRARRKRRSKKSDEGST
jgi:hypothetical protein